MTRSGGVRNVAQQLRLTTLARRGQVAWRHQTGTDQQRPDDDLKTPGAAPMDVTVNSQEHGNVVLVTVSGDVDVYTAAGLRDHLDRLIATGHRHLVLDLREVPFMDSTGLGVLVGRLKLTRLQKGSLRVACTVPRILRVFEITGLNQVLAVYDDPMTAVQDAQDQAAQVTDPDCV